MDRSTWLKGAAVAAGLGLAWWLLRSAGLDLRELSQGAIRNYVLSFGAWAPAVYLLTYCQPLVPLPASMMMVAGGLAFGPVGGAVASLFGATVRACGQLGLARWLGQGRVSGSLKGRVAEINRHLEERSFRTVLLIRLVPNLPFDVQNYLLGFSRVKFWPFLSATLLGLLPGTIAFVYFGHTLAEPGRFWQVMAALALIAVLIAFTSWWKRRRDV